MMSGVATADAASVYIELPIGIKGARSCTASASAVSLHAANVQINETLSLELLNKP